MATVSFDTLEYVKTLKSGGFSEEQAEAHARAHKQLLSEVPPTALATKDDIHRLERELLVVKWMAGFALTGIATIIMLLMRLLFILPS